MSDFTTGKHHEVPQGQGPVFPVTDTDDVQWIDTPFVDPASMEPKPEKKEPERRPATADHKPTPEPAHPARTK